MAMTANYTVKSSSTARVAPAKLAQRRNVSSRAAQEVTGMVFQPFSEVQNELSTVTKAPGTESYARVDYQPECEAAVNEQINIEYTISYVYHALHAYFARDNVGLPGFAKFFADASEEERGHAQLLMDYQVKRGGRVELKVCAINMDCLNFPFCKHILCIFFFYMKPRLSHHARGLSRASAWH